MSLCGSACQSITRQRQRNDSPTSQKHCQYLTPIDSSNEDVWSLDLRARTQ